VVRNDTQLTLSRRPEGAGGIEEETITLVPTGYPGGVEVDDDDDDTDAIDMGMELCVIGKACK
jgi:hypothetical protein